MNREPKVPEFVLLLAIVALSGILTSGMTELLQGYLEYRDCDIKDFWADSIGILLGVATATRMFVLGRRRKQVILSQNIPYDMPSAK